MLSIRGFKAILVGAAFCSAQPALARPADECIASYQSKNYRIAFQLCKALAERGNALAQNLLGFMYQHGQGVPVSYPKALKWIRKSARQGNAAARNNLGVMYRYGTGVRKNYSRAAYWFRKSAETGNATGQVNLGHAYQNGRGVRASHVKAYMWYSLATRSASNSFEANLANANLKIVTQRMTTNQISRARILVQKCWYKRYRGC